MCGKMVSRNRVGWFYTEIRTNIVLENGCFGTWGNPDHENHLIVSKPANQDCFQNVAMLPPKRCQYSFQKFFFLPCLSLIWRCHMQLMQNNYVKQCCYQPALNYHLYHTITFEPKEQEYSFSVLIGFLHHRFTRRTGVILFSSPRSCIH